MPVWTISRYDGKPISGFVFGLGGKAKAKRKFSTEETANRVWEMMRRRDPKGFEAREYSMNETRNLKDHLKLDTHCPALVLAVKAAPMDDVAQRVLADRLTELGIEYKRAYRAARQIAFDCLNPLAWPKADLNKLLKGTTLAHIQAALNAANGRRRERVVSLASALEACRLARKYGAAVRGGGTVANSYGYSAVQTGFVVAVGSNGKLRWRAGIVPATRGTSVSNQLAGLPINSTRDQWRAWADAG